MPSEILSRHVCRPREATHVHRSHRHWQVCPHQQLPRTAAKGPVSHCSTHVHGHVHCIIFIHVQYMSVTLGIFCSFPDCRYVPNCVNFSARTSANLTQDIIMSKLDRYVRGLSQMDHSPCMMYLYILPATLSIIVNLRTAPPSSPAGVGRVCLVQRWVRSVWCLWTTSTCQPRRCTEHSRPLSCCDSGRTIATGTTARTPPEWTLWTW